MTAERRPLQILALLSDPLAADGRPVVRLDLRATAERLRQQLQSIRYSVSLHFVIASPHAVLNAVRDHGPFDVIHFDGHGDKGDLVFEDDRGGVLEVNELRLRAMFAPEGHPPATVAFLSACHSASVADALLQCGVQHVVAIDTDAAVLDVAARAFAAQFYPALVSGRSVRAAFDYGRAIVLNDPGVRTACQQLSPQDPDLRNIEETLKFHLLPEDGDSQPDPHGPCPFAGLPAGSLTVFEHFGGLPETLPARPDFFTGPRGRVA